MENSVLQDKQKCCGCGACKDACPNNCITMEFDDEGFKYPFVDRTKCIKCNLCRKACPIDRNLTQDYVTRFFAGYANDSTVMLESSSGGIFWPIVKNFLNKDSVVYGAVLNDGLSVCHERHDNLNDCKSFRKSKYLQSDLNGIYKKVKIDLNNNLNVLFSGTPCQIAALYSYLGRDYSNLYTIDVVCHGVPSNAVFNLYISEQEKRFKKKIISYCWRDKRKGWGPNRVSMIFDDGSFKMMTSQSNPMQKGFLDNWFLRPSCYMCQFAKLPRVADISLADFWGYDLELQKSNRNKGLSLIAISTEKGLLLFESIKNDIIYHEVSRDYACSKSRHLWIHPKANDKRDLFMMEFKNGKSFNYLAKKYIMPSLFNRFRISYNRQITRLIKIWKQ